MRFMLDHQIERPGGYAERGCLLVNYRLPLLDHCHILCHESSGEAPSPTGLLSFAVEQAAQIAQREVGDREAFILIQSGHTVRKRGNWHAHIFVIQHRWQKAWIYLILGLKNLALVLLHPFIKARATSKAIERSIS